LIGTKPLLLSKLERLQKRPGNLILVQTSIWLLTQMKYKVLTLVLAMILSWLAMVMTYLSLALDTLFFPTTNLKLNNVLVAPTIKKKLLSVSQFTRDNNCYFLFYLLGFILKNMMYCLFQFLVTSHLMKWFLVLLLLMNLYEFLGALTTHYLHHLVDQNWTLSLHGVFLLVTQTITKYIVVLNLRQVASIYLSMWNSINFNFPIDACRNLAHMLFSCLKLENFLNYSRPWQKNPLF
jgi:hypothetical protein